MNSVQGLAAQLRALLIPVIGTSPIGELEDGCIDITPLLHVQVGSNYLSVVEDLNNGTFKFHDVPNTVAGVARKIKELTNPRFVTPINQG